MGTVPRGIRWDTSASGGDTCVANTKRGFLEERAMAYKLFTGRRTYHYG